MHGNLKASTEFNHINSQLCICPENVHVRGGNSIQSLNLLLTWDLMSHLFKKKKFRGKKKLLEEHIHDFFLLPVYEAKLRTKRKETQMGKEKDISYAKSIGINKLKINNDNASTFLASIWLSKTRGDRVLAKEVDLDQSNSEACPLRIRLKLSWKGTLNPKENYQATKKNSSMHITLFPNLCFLRIDLQTQDKDRGKSSTVSPTPKSPQANIFIVNLSWQASVISSIRITINK